MGDSVGRWDGDTLVVDVNNLNDDTWLGSDGYFHTEACTSSSGSPGTATR